MTQKLWQEKLKLNYSKDVLDIIQFGSSVIEGSSPRDLDIAVLYLKIPLKEQLNQSQEIKKQLQKLSKLPIHINSFDLYSLFEPSNFARENILFYGKSILLKDYLANRFGLKPRVQILYSLKELKKKDKIKFNYLLNGKKGKYGLLRKHGGKILKPGLIEIFPEYKDIFINSLKQITSNLESRNIFC